MDEYEEELDDFGPSKSAIKREMTALQKLGERLTNLPAKQLEQIPINDDRLYMAIEEAHRIRSKNALKRHHQYIGKLMRDIDPAPIEQALAALDQRHHQSVAQFHAMEQLRDEALEKGAQGAELIIARFPDADRQQLRQLLLQHQRELSKNKPPAAKRKLFQYIKSLSD